MKHCGLLTALLLFATPGLLPNLAAAETKVPYAWPLSTANGLFHLWLPKDAPTIKGLLVFPYHGTGEQWSDNPHFPALRSDPMALSGASRKKINLAQFFLATFPFWRQIYIENRSIAPHTQGLDMQFPGYQETRDHH